MSQEIDDTPNPAEPGDASRPPREPEPKLEVEEHAPDGGAPLSEPAAPSPEDRSRPFEENPPSLESEPEPESEQEQEPIEAEPVRAHAAVESDEEDVENEDEAEEEEDEEIAAAAAVAPTVEDEEPPPKLTWYVLKVQSGREDTIRDTLERRVKIQGISRHFGRIVVPTEKVTEIRNGKKRTREHKSLPGYIMVEMELNENTWYTVRETPGVGDFVGGARGDKAEPWKHATPMTETEVDRMLGLEKQRVDDRAKPRIDFERGDRVKIKEGPFENFEGTVEEVIEARGLVKVMLVIFSRNTPVDLEYWQVERL